MQPIKAFLFDLDGVIVDTAIYHYQAWRRMANELGFDISEEFNEGLKGVSRMDSLDLILAHGNVQLPEEKKLELATLKNEWYLKLVSRMTPNDILPGIPAFFAQVREAGLKTALGSVSKNAGLILERIGMTDRFDAIIDGNKISKGKPDPEVFLKGRRNSVLDRVSVSYLRTPWRALNQRFGRVPGRLVSVHRMSLQKLI